MKTNLFSKNILFVVLVTLVFFVIMESVLRLAYFVRNSMISQVALPYVIGHDYGPIPPWTKDLRILEPDSTLIWKSRPNVNRRYIDIFSPVYSQKKRMSIIRGFFPFIPDSMKENPVWEISLNSEGFREKEFINEKPGSVFRIICLGDSWTFGANVSDEDTYPRQLGRLLAQEYPRTHFEVLNLGVLGYSSFQGLELLKSRVLDLNPDILIIGFAMNDSSIAGYRDKDMTGSTEELPLKEKVGAILEKIEVYKLLRYMALTLKHKPKTAGQHLKRIADSSQDAEEAIDYDNLEPWTRVSPKDYKENMLQMIELARKRNISIVLMYNQLSSDAGDVAGIGYLGKKSPYREVLDDVSMKEGIPLVDSSILISKERRRIESNIEDTLNLQPLKASGSLSGDTIQVVFRVYQGRHQVPDCIYITGTHPGLGSMTPNKLSMYDDGTHGDQRAGDRVWSYAALMDRGTKVFYVYTNSGPSGEWKGLDVPYIRQFSINAKTEGKRIYRPIETFGKVYMQADSWHTNADGYALIAKALVNVIKDDVTAKRYLAGVSTE